MLAVLLESGMAALNSLVDTFDVPVFAFTVAILLIVIVPLIILLMPFAARQTIRVSSEMLSRRLSGQTDTIAWDDVLVFALVDGRKRPGATAIYILSSGKKSVRWTHYSRTRWYFVTAPTTSDEEYQRQMNALLSYAAARTGLPLLDLR